jgi:hypothetical protein
MYVYSSCIVKLINNKRLKLLSLKYFKILKYFKDNKNEDINLTHFQLINLAFKIYFFS